MIGLYGGTFNPVHYGHLRTALEVHDILGLDELRFVPCSVPAHRAEPEVAASMRVQMLQLAINSYAQFVCDQRELQRPGPSYMLDTLISMRTEVADRTPLLLIIGSDAFNGLRSWYRWQELFDYAHIVVMTRPNYVHRALERFFTDRHVTERQSLKLATNGKIYFQNVTQLDISATIIRQMFADNKKTDFLLPDPVIKFIQANGLYSERKLHAS